MKVSLLAVYQGRLSPPEFRPQALKRGGYVGVSARVNSCPSRFTLRSKLFLKISCLVFATYGMATAESNPNAARDAKLIAQVKQISVHKLDQALPDVGFEGWLQKQSGADAKYHWEVNDCGEQSGTPGDDAPVPTCVEADSRLNDGREIVIMIADDRPETTGKTHPPDWKIFFAQLTTPHEKINLRRLSDLPAALTRTQ